MGGYYDAGKASYDRKKKQWEKLTKAEQDYIFWNPDDAAAIERDAKKALAEAEKRFGGGSLHNGAGDAFRHCYWSALLARDIGKDGAVRFTNAHEDFPGNPAREKDMDLNNNTVGVEIGAASPNVSDDALANKCFDALNTGKLKVIGP